MVPCYCTAPATYGALCTRHAQGLMYVIRDAPTLLRELDTTAARLDVQTPPVGGTGAWDAPLPVNLGAVAAADRLRAALDNAAAATRADRRRNGRPNAADAASDALTGFRRLVGHANAHGLALDVLEAYRAAQRATDRAPEKIRYGVCNCGAELTAPADRATVNCRACALTYDAAELRAFRYVAAMDALADYAGTLGELQRLLSATGHSVTVRQLEGWTVRKKNPLTPSGTRGRFHVYRYADAAEIARHAN